LAYPVYPSSYGGSVAAYPQAPPYASSAYQPQPTQQVSAAQPVTYSSLSQPQRATYYNPNNRAQYSSGYQGTSNAANSGHTPYQGQEKDAQIISSNYDFDPSDSHFEYR
jgi:hypothetical protein